MAYQTVIIHQDILKADCPPIPTISIHENDLSTTVLSAFLLSGANQPIGLSAAYGTRRVMQAIAFSTSSQVLVVKLATKTKPTVKKKGKKNVNGHSQPGRQLLRDMILCAKHRKVAVNMDRIAISLHIDLGMHIVDGVDLVSAMRSEQFTADDMVQLLGGQFAAHKATVANLFKDDSYSADRLRYISLQAWVAQRAAEKVQRLHALPAIHTGTLDQHHLSSMAEIHRNGDRLVALKPTVVKNDVQKDLTEKLGKLQVSSTRYKTRLRFSASQTLQLEMGHKGQTIKVKGRAMGVEGKTATITISGAKGSTIRAIHTIGREDPTNAEALRSKVIRLFLQRSAGFFNHYFSQSIWDPSTSLSTGGLTSAVPADIVFPHRPLNPSQRKAVRAMISDEDRHRLTVIHGPPGTGKTTVISACVTSLIAGRDRSRGIWLVAQSNVAVKNIAEKLADVGFLDFRLLVSHDFHFEWHEHLYEEIERNVIQSDTFEGDIVGNERLLGGARVILCTLSMLSSNKLRVAGFTTLVPINTVIVDEASQIEIGDYLPLLHLFKPTLRKLVFIGDDKQLAPYGQDDLGDLRSIFEIPHLRQGAIFLDTQYRMPRPIGDFISRHMYKGQLKTVHAISDRSSCRLVDVPNGKEKQSGKSWVNLEEVKAVMHIARRCVQQSRNFRIITPYDPQRAALERELQVAKLPWEDKCFNVDSFQGNEDDTIIISCVRTQKVGFLKNPRRTNVMLSRCKKSMFIVTNRAFMSGQQAETTLPGKLVAEWGPDSWLSWKDIMNGRFAL